MTAADHAARAQAHAARAEQLAEKISPMAERSRKTRYDARDHFEATAGVLHAQLAHWHQMQADRA